MYICTHTHIHTHIHAIKKQWFVYGDSRCIMFWVFSWSSVLRENGLWNVALFWCWMFMCLLFTFSLITKTCWLFYFQVVQGLMLVVGTVGFKIVVSKLFSVADDVSTSVPSVMSWMFLSGKANGLDQQMDHLTNTFFNNTRQYNIQFLNKIIFFKYRTREIKALETNK